MSPVCDRDFCVYEGLYQFVSGIILSEIASIAQVFFPSRSRCFIVYISHRVCEINFPDNPVMLGKYSLPAPGMVMVPRQYLWEG